MGQQPSNYLQPQQPPPRRGLFGWYRRQRPFAKIALGCFSLALVLSLCVVSLVVIATSATANQPQAQTATPTQAQQAVAGATDMATQAPTNVPTVKPTTKPTARPTPKPIPTKPPAPKLTPTPCASPCNPWGYNFSPGNLIYSPNAAFCSYFSCIPNFWNGHGFVNECQDSTYSKSGGIRGDCSDHGGELRPLYAH